MSASLVFVKLLTPLVRPFTQIVEKGQVLPTLIGTSLGITIGALTGGYFIELGGIIGAIVLGLIAAVITAWFFPEPVPPPRPDGWMGQIQHIAPWQDEFTRFLTVVFDNAIFMSRDDDIDWDEVIQKLEAGWSPPITIRGETNIIPMDTIRDVATIADGSVIRISFDYLGKLKTRNAPVDSTHTAEFLREIITRRVSITSANAGIAPNTTRKRRRPTVDASAASPASLEKTSDADPPLMSREEAFFRNLDRKSEAKALQQSHSATKTWSVVIGIAGIALAFIVHLSKQPSRKPAPPNIRPEQMQQIGNLFARLESKSFVNPMQVSERPGKGSASLNEARTLLRDAKYAQALDKLDPLVSKDPNNFDGRILRAITYVKLHRFENAIEDATAAQVLYPVSPWPLYIRAEANAARPDDDSADRDYRAAFEKWSAILEAPIGSNVFAVGDAAKQMLDCIRRLESRGKLDESQVMAETLVPQIERRLQNDPGSLELALALARALISEARIHQAQNRKPESADRLRRAKVTLNSILEQAPNMHEASELLESIHAVDAGNS
jgi:tetratricopeptide (TPR) repeat protein